MSSILVTGGAGFIGGHLVDRLIDDGHTVYVIDNLSSGKTENINPKAIFIYGDILDTMVYPPISKIYHLAAIPRVPYSMEHPIETHNTNVNGTLAILDLARQANAKVVFASSSSVYGDQKLPLNETKRKYPISPYALHKSIGEDYMTLWNDIYNIPTVAMRFFNVYGPRANVDSEYSLVIGKFLKQKALGKPLTIFGDGEQTRDFTYVDDIVEGCVRAMDSDVRGETINLCNGDGVSINEIADQIGGEKVYQPKRPGDILHTLGDNSKAKKLLDWQPTTSIKEGIKLITNEHIIER